MRSTASLDIQIGNTDIPIKIYSAVEQETHFKQVSVCCNSAVNYKKVCSSCQAELSQDQIKKALEVGDELKQVNSEIVKVENSNLKVLGIISDENEENGLFRDGLVWFIGFETEKKNKGKHERNLTKFSYLRESLRASGVSLLCLVNVRGKEHIILLKIKEKRHLTKDFSFSEIVKNIRIGISARRSEINYYTERGLKC